MKHHKLKNHWGLMVDFALLFLSAIFHKITEAHINVPEWINNWLSSILGSRDRMQLSIGPQLLHMCWRL